MSKKIDNVVQHSTLTHAVNQLQQACTTVMRVIGAVWADYKQVTGGQSPQLSGTHIEGQLGCAIVSQTEHDDARVRKSQHVLRFDLF